MQLHIVSIIAVGVSSINTQTMDAAQPNPPLWPASVVVFGPDDANITERMAERSEMLNNRAVGHFSSERLAFLFKPGRYAVEAKIGYYTSLSGLGDTPGAAVFGGERGVYVDAMDPQAAGSLDTFWRSGDNFKHDAAQGFRWAVGQAAPLRRIIAARDLELFEPTAKVNYASGGYLGNSVVEGDLVLGSQQQWLNRNVELRGGATGGAWSNVYVGCAGSVPEPSAPGVEPRVSVVEAAPVIAAKPYIVIDATGKYSLLVPRVEKHSVGAGLDAPYREVPFERVFVADASKHGARDINEALSKGLDVVLAPGIFQLEASIELSRPGAAVLGLGYATLVAPAPGAPCVGAAAVLQASEVPEVEDSVLLRWGGRGSTRDPSVLSDVFCRVGGPGSLKVRADVMVEVQASHTILDNLWLWRADHAELAPGEQPRPGEQYHLVVPGECRTKNGLIVDGDDVTAYGLAVEHTDEDQVIWNGERGRTYFYQCELPYDTASYSRRVSFKCLASLTSQFLHRYDVNQTMFGDKGYTGYRLAAGVGTHACVAPGIYSYFRDYPCLVPAGIVAPASAEFVNAFTKKLRAHDGILSVIERV